MDKILTPDAGRNILTRGLPKSGQLTSYRAGDDGEFEAGWWQGRLNVNNRDRWIAKRIGADDIVFDRATGLMWAGNGSAAGCNNGGAISWDDAIDYAIALNFAGFLDWRLPNIKELISILEYDAAIGAPYIAEPPFENTVSSYYWASTTYMPNTFKAYILHFGTGYFSSDDKDMGPDYLRCVRDGL